MALRPHIKITAFEFSCRPGEPCRCYIHGEATIDPVDDVASWESFKTNLQIQRWAQGIIMGGARGWPVRDRDKAA